MTFYPSGKNVSIELASYLTTVFDQSGATRLASTQGINDLSIVSLDDDLENVLEAQNLTLPALLQIVSIRLSFFVFLRLISFQWLAKQNEICSTGALKLLGTV